MPPLQNWPEILNALLEGEDLSVSDAAWCMEQVMTGAVTEAQLAAFLVMLRVKGETVDEIVGFRDAVLEHAVALPVDPMALDIYCWATYRMSYLAKPTTVPWAALAAQFGSDYARLRDFKAAFLAELRKVMAVYPDAAAQPSDAGLVLRPSATHVGLQRALPGG